MNSKILWLTDRSRIAAYRECPRLRYYTYHFRGKGLQRVTRSLPLINGDFIHKAFAALLTGHELDSTLEALVNDYRSRFTDGDAFLLGEQLCLLEGLVRAWHAVRLPHILAEFEVIDVERECAWDLSSDIRVMVRMDAVLRRKADRLLFVKDFKTLSAVYDDFGKRYEHDSQLLCYTLAAEAIYNEPIGGLLMEGIIKGKRAKDKALSSPFRDTIIQQSPLCYGYRSKTPSGQPLYERSWSRVSEKVPVWEMTGGITDWLHNEFSPMDLAEFFVLAPAIKPMRRDMERWQRQVIAQERHIKEIVVEAEALREAFERAVGTDDEDRMWDNFQLVLDQEFPQNHNHCFRYFGHPCPVERLCFTEAIEADPLNSGFYEERIPHHSTEEDTQ